MPRGTDDIHNIPATLSIERLERVISNNVDVLDGLTEDEYVDIIFYAASVIETSPDAMRLLKVSKALLAATERESL